MTTGQKYTIYDYFTKSHQASIFDIFHKFSNNFQSDTLWRYSLSSLQNNTKIYTAMVTKSNKSDEPKKSTKLDRLELVDKKVEIIKKRLEIKKERMSISKMYLEKEKELLDLVDKEVSISTKKLENRKAELEMEEVLINRKHDEDRVQSDKLFSVMFTLIVSTIDSERTILGSEPFYTPLLDGRNKEIALNKLMDLIIKL